MDVLVLGGSGIISSEIVNLLIERKHSVTIINRGKRQQFIHPESKLVIADLKNDDTDSIASKLRNYYDVIVDVISYKPEELKRNMALARNRCEQYILFSTSVVYSTKSGRYVEEDRTANQKWSYAIYKEACESYLMSNAESYGFKYTIIRPYITYGKTRVPLQFGPLQYYTVVNRAKAGKTIPVFDREVKCTLTYSKDFAIGAVGLMLNELAYNQAFHITGQYETTWNQILKKTIDAFGYELRTVQLSERDFENEKLMNGLNWDEVIGDKSRDMLFDNSKIINAVPEFKASVKYEEVLPDIIDFFSNAENQKIDYAWDGRVDSMLSKLPWLSKEEKKKLKFSPGANASRQDKMTYYWHRSDIAFSIYGIISKFHK